MTLTTRKPKAPVASYGLTYAWVLDHHYLRSETSDKPDGSQEVAMLGYDPVGKAFPLWVFNSSGLAFSLPRGEWDESTRTMTWKNAPTDPVLYNSRCTFEATTLRCSTQVKNLSGAIFFDFDSISQRRRP